ncbi:glucose 1-dehydrogenase [Paenibacillus methanolicus]|uniref:glucose 1-dehydrogenase n=1 Tax=Paenibacillus methanolicus TaxID=582686 RepID=UPI001FE5B29F|nr:glucose 1-dehydrogenase [Paenibacillus methanolicus]
MKAAKVTDMKRSKTIRVGEHPKPAIAQPSEVLVKVLAVGLDGTDREIMTGPYGEAPQGEDELIIGHEAMGIVVESGQEAGLAPGDLVSVVVRRPCHDPACVNCRNGRSDFCQSSQYTERGIKGAHGFLTEYIKDEDRFFIKLPEACLPFGMMAEPQSIVEKVWDEVQHIQQRLVWEPRSALVLGSGPLGLLAALTSRCLDLNVHVWSMSAPDSPEARLIERIGGIYQQANASGGPASLTAYAESIGAHFDLVWECTGYSPLGFEAMDVLAPNGVLAMLGLSAGGRKSEIPVDKLNMEMVLENKCVIGSVNASRKHFETGVYRLQQMEARWPGVVTSMITKRFAMDDVPQVDFNAIGIKAVVDVVPVEQWKSGASAEETAYSFSV